MNLRIGLVTTLALNAAMASYAQAETNSTTDSGIWGDSTDVSLTLAASYAPRYQGSKNYVSGFQPVLRVERGIFFLDSEDGLGVQWQSNSGFSASASVGYDYGRADGDSDFRYGSDKLKGMGEVSGATVLNLYASQELTSWLSAHAQAEMRLAGAKRGNQYSFGLESTLFNTDHDTVSWGVDAHAGDSDYNQTYFGVTPLQSVSSNFDPYRADGGIFAYSTGLSWLHNFNDNWSTIAGVQLTHYTDQVRNSPVITKDTGATGYMGVTYKF
ncbi:MipA/OmpV family protein [Pseudomonas monteilii]|uniref:MipA/OmpV family protein n=1 Tax=Pseudomonas monteilii TaxID=76759 RepID=UPI00383B0023